MARPRFSIVIPTRNRPETLEGTLRTCLAQTFEDFEIVVCDNCGDPRTRDVVRSASSSKINYVRSDVALAMSDNWERALSQAQGDFVTILGDDDGLLLHGLQEADERIRTMDLKVLVMAQVIYFWPGLEGTGIPANTLIVPRMHPRRVSRARRMLQGAVYYLPNTPGLPSFYNSFVHRDIVPKLRAKTGKVFNGASPDWYSGLAIAALVDRYGTGGVPLRIAGGSRKGNGLATLQGGSSQVADEFVRLNMMSGLKWNPKVPNVPKSVSALAAECLQQVKENLLPEDSDLRLDAKTLVDAIVFEIRHSAYPISREEWTAYVQELETYVSRDEKIAKWFTAKFPRLAQSVPPTWVPPATQAFGLTDGGLKLDASQFGVVDVYGAAELFERIFRRTSNSSTACDAVSPFDVWAASCKELFHEVAPAVLVGALRVLRRRVGRVQRGVS